MAQSRFNPARYLAGKNSLIGALGLFLVAGSLLLLWFFILSGVTGATPLDRTYFLRADTSGITGARPITQWTYFQFCGLNNNDCGSAQAAPPFGQAWARDAANVPGRLIGNDGDHTTSQRFYYLWRFGWVFFILTLFFEHLALFAGFLAFFGRLGAAIASLATAFALFLFAVSICLFTSTFVLARNIFHDAGRSAQIGAYAFGFVWASFACLILANMIFCLGIRSEKGYSGRKWRRNRSVRSTKNGNGRRVKEEYA